MEKTNHDHLGKSITYASALGAKTIVWIATDFTEEHKKALDWLNDNTNEDLAFWGVQLELWQISEETASMRLNIVSRPSTNVKTSRARPIMKVNLGIFSWNFGLNLEISCKALRRFLHCRLLNLAIGMMLE